MSILSNPDHVSYNMPLYQFMREHSLSDFAMEELEASICADRKQQLMREQHWMDELKPTLNKIRAFLDDPTQKAQERVRRKRYEEKNRAKSELETEQTGRSTTKKTSKSSSRNKKFTRRPIEQKSIEKGLIA